MENRTVTILACTTIALLVVLIIVARVSLKLSRPFFFIAGADVAVILAVVSYLFIRRRYNNRSKILRTQMVSESRELRIEYSFLRKVACVPTKFRYQEIEDATANFQSFLGRGASASVFKGVLSDGTAVAVKRIGPEARGEKEFRSEVAAIASVQHLNLARLIGYCIVPNQSRYLVYDFVPNGSLDCWIFPQKIGGNGNPNPRCLTFDLRYRVAIDVAKALNYLHSDCRSRILHLDVKPENILLDENHRAIVSDFGLSKLMRRDESRVITNIRGTRGYLAPEWLLELGISEKSDVYSYGMVLLEMVGGRRNVCRGKRSGKEKSGKWEYFPRIVEQRMREGKLIEVVDRRLLENGGSGIEERELTRLVHVAFWCIQEEAPLRPTMGTVVEMLEGRVPVGQPPETQMMLVDMLSMDEDSSREVQNNNNRRLVAVPIAKVDDTPVAAVLSGSFTMSVISGR
ncbi:unnamed protein product [Linum trigynum]|uniref:Protein kinase domain-containing protein n=1 Tax=Linum trigynum TaxID=586398 RepID=A0AAV2CRV1_9ROSI